MFTLQKKIKNWSERSLHYHQWRSAASIGCKAIGFRLKINERVSAWFTEIKAVSGVNEPYCKLYFGSHHTWNASGDLQFWHAILAGGGVDFSNGCYRVLRLPASFHEATRRIFLRVSGASVQLDSANDSVNDVCYWWGVLLLLFFYYYDNIFY